jgi:putative intracellular protease/amidase
MPQIQTRQIPGSQIPSRLAPTQAGTHILIVTTSHNLMDSGDLTGVWAEELATPCYLFRDAGAKVTIASVRGGPVPFDPRSISGSEPQSDSVQRMLRDRMLMDALLATPAVGSLDSLLFDAIFLPGGHGTMWDLPHSGALAACIADLDSRGQPVAAVCHGPAGLLGVTRRNGDALVSGRRVTGFTNSEERRVGLAKIVPFLLQDRLVEQGGQFEAAEDFQPHALRDGNLITGQNPASSLLTAQLLLRALHERHVKAA